MFNGKVSLQQTTIYVIWTWTKIMDFPCKQCQPVQTLWQIWPLPPLLSPQNSIAFVYLSSQFLQTPIQWKLSCLAILHIFTFNQNHLIQTFQTHQFVYFLFDAKTPDVADYVANKSTIIGYILWFSTNLVFWDENEKMISQGGGEKLSWFSQEFPGSRILAGLCHYSPANVLSTG